MVRFGVYSGDPLCAERRLRERLVALGPAHKHVVFGDEVTPAQLLLELQTPDLFEERKAVVVRRADPLRGERELGQILRTHLSPGVAVFFLGEDLRGPLAESAEEARHFPRPMGQELRELCETLLREAGLAAHPFVVGMLVEAAGGDTLRLAQEVEKFAVWKGGKLPRARLPELCFFAQPQPYEFLDAVGHGKSLEALAALGRLLRARWNPQVLFHFLVGHMRALLFALSAEAQGEKAKGPEWLVRRRLSQARRHGEARLIGALQLLQELEVQIKLGALAPEDALHLFILRWGEASPAPARPGRCAPEAAS